MVWPKQSEPLGNQIAGEKSLMRHLDNTKQRLYIHKPYVLVSTW